jgi:hypothetical protein
MLKNVYLALLLFAFIQLNLTAQTPKNTLDGMYLSFKGGFHTGDYDQSYNNFSSGFSMDGTVEVHTGKNWYAGLNYDVSYGNENYFGQIKDLTLNSFTLMVKYRYFIKDFAAVYAGLGVGGSTMIIDNYNKDKMMASNVRFGVDFPFEQNFVLSAEAVYHAMGEFRMDSGGRHNNIAMFKLGFGYWFSLKQ